MINHIEAVLADDSHDERMIMRAREALLAASGTGRLEAALATAPTAPVPAPTAPTAAAPTEPTAPTPPSPESWWLQHVLEPTSPTVPGPAAFAVAIAGTTGRVG